MSALRRIPQSAERDELSRRARSAVRTDPGHDIVDTYETVKAKRKVTIKASAAQPKAYFTNDPALKPERPADKNGGKQDAKPAEDVRPKSEDLVTFDDVPETARCRRVETQVAEASATKSDVGSNVPTSSAVVCEVGENNWKPVKRR